MTLNIYFLDAIGSASYVVTETDYDNYGMVCTCQVECTSYARYNIAKHSNIVGVRESKS